MELIVLSNPEAIANEAKIINQLFEAGMTRFHLRKPGWSDHQCLDLLKDIDPAFHPHIALHQHYAIANEISTKRLHYPEKHRFDSSEAEIIKLKQEGFTCSTAMHELTALPHLTAFDYVFFSPVFDSISKPGYESKLAKGFILQKVNAQPAVIALGGVDAQNIRQIRQMQFDGAAVLGTIWKQPEQAVTSFQNLNKIINFRK